MSAFPAAARLAAFRAAFSAIGLDGVVVPRADGWRSEVSAPREDCLAYLTGFTGSAGLALVLADRALLFVDGRYGLQARRQVDGGLFAFRHLHAEPVEDVLRQDAPGLRIGVDPMRVSSAEFDRLAEAVEVGGGMLVALEGDLFDRIWPDRPPAPSGPVRPMPVERAGRSARDKRREAAGALRAAGADALVETSPENIAWLLNVRGTDVPMNPVVQSFLILRDDGSATWFVDPPQAAGRAGGSGRRGRGRRQPRGSSGAARRRRRRPPRDPRSGRRAGRRRPCRNGRRQPPRRTIEPPDPRQGPQDASRAGRLPALSRRGRRRADGFPRRRRRDRASPCGDGRTHDRVGGGSASRSLPQQAHGLPGTVVPVDLRVGSERRPLPLRRDPGNRCAARTGSALPDRFRRAVRGRHDRRHPDAVPGTAPFRRPAGLHRRAEGFPRAVHGALPGRNLRSSARRPRPDAAVGARAGLRPRHRSRRRAQSAGARVSAPLRQGRQPVSAGTGDDHDHRTGLLPAGRVGSQDREPGRSGGGRPGFLPLRAADARTDRPRCGRRRRAHPAEIDHLDRYHARVRAVLAPLVRPQTRLFLDRATRPVKG